MGAKYKLVKILSAEEVEEKMEMGLCFVCNEPFNVDHSLKHKGIRYKVTEMDEEVERDLSEKFQPETSSKDNNLQIDFDKECVVHDDDTSKVAVNVVDDDFANFHQFVDVISINPVRIIVDKQEEMVLPAIDISTSSAISLPCYDILSSAKFSPRQVSVDPLSDTIEISHFMSFNQPLSNYVLLTGKDFRPLSHICELPPPPKPPDRVVTLISSLNLSLLVTTAKHFSILQTSLQLFDEMPECHINVWCGRHTKKFKWSLEILITVPNYQIMKVIEPLLDGVCTEVPKDLAPGPQLVHTWNYSHDLFHDDCSYVLANIYCYFDDGARIRRFDFVPKASGIKHTIGELFYDHLIFQRSEAKGARFYALEFVLFLLAIFGSKIWIMSFVNEESQFLYLMALGSSVGTHELVKINDGKNMEVPNIYRQMDSYYGVLTTSFFQVAKLCASHLDASLDKEKSDNIVYHGNYLFSVTSINMVAVMVGTRQEWLRKYPLSEELVTELGRQRKFNYYIYALMCLHLEISNGVFNHLIGISMVAIQIFLKHKFKVQWLPSIITTTGDFNQYIIRKVWNEPFQLQGDSMINSTASSPNSNFLRLLQLLLLKLGQKSHFGVVNFVVNLAIWHRKMIPRGQFLLCKHLEIFRFDHEIVAVSLNCSSICMLAVTVCVNGGSVIVIKILLKWRNLPPNTLKFAANVDLIAAILHRKLIERGSVHVPLLMVKWKTLPPKHGT